MFRNAALIYSESIAWAYSTFSIGSSLILFAGKLVRHLWSRSLTPLCVLELACKVKPNHKLMF